MALNDNRGSREFDKFVADGSGDTSLRVTTTTSVTTSASNTTATVEDTSAASASVVLTETDVEGKSRIGIQIFNTPVKALGITGQTGHSTQTSTCDIYLMAD